MRIRELRVESLLHFGRCALDFGEGRPDLHILYGPNEAGKSTLLQVISNLLFGGKMEGEEQERYDARSRIEGVLQHPGLSPIRLQRRRRYKQLFLSEDGGADPGSQEKWLAAALGGYDRERYTLLFGFDHERLRKGGDSLLQSGGHAGISLFEAGGGGQRLQNLLRRLSDRAGELVDPTFNGRSAKRLNKALRAYREEEAAVRSSGLRAEDWQELRDAIDGLEEKIGRLRRQRSDWEKEASRLRRILRVRGMLGELRQLRLEMGGVDPAALPSPGQAERILSASDGLRSAEREVERLMEARRRHSEAESGIGLDIPALESEEEIERLSEGLEQYLARRDDEIPGLLLQIRQRRSDADSLGESLAPGARPEEFDKLRIPFAREETVQLLAARLEQARSAAAVERERHEELARERALLEEALGRSGDVPDVAELRRLAAQAREEGDIEGALQKKEEEIRRRQAILQSDLASQSLWSGSAESLKTLPVPLRETVERHSALWHGEQEAAKKVRSELERAARDLEDTFLQMEELEQGGRVPVDEDLLEARSRRDAEWRLVKRAWLGDGGAREFGEEEDRESDGAPLPEAYEASVRKADEIADWMRRESGRSAQKAQVLRRRDQLERNIERLNRELEEREARLGQLAREWRAEWEASQIDPKPPAEMREWLTNHHRPIVEGLSALRLAEADREDLKRRRDALCREIEAVLAKQAPGRTPYPNPGRPDLKGLLQLCDETLEDAGNRLNRRTSLLDQLNVCVQKQTDRGHRRSRAESRLHSAECEWRDLHALYPTLPEDPEVAVRYIARMRQWFQWLDEVKGLQSEARAKQDWCERYERRVFSLAARMDDPASPTETADASARSVEDRVRDARRRLREAKEAWAKRAQLREEAARTEEEIRAARAGLDAFLTELEALREECGGADAESLSVLARQSKDFYSLDSARRELEARLIEAGDGFGVAELEAESDGMEDPDELASRAAALEGEISGLESVLTGEQKQLWELRHRFSQLDGSRSEAAEHAQNAESHLAEADRVWGEYLRVELARRLLQRAVEEFRRQNESAVLQKAGGFFRRLTLGRYVALTVEYEGVEPYLQAVHADGGKRRVSQMSDGTRDQLFLSLRLAFSDRHLNGSHPLPLIMDDILVHFDDRRTREALEVLGELSGRTQILYFTHHEAVVEAAQKLSVAGGARIHRVETADLPSR